jgi:uncharacterized membrane protein
MQSVQHIAWNIFLAIIPVLLGVFIAHGIRADRASVFRKPRWVIWAPVLLLWLVFLPNTVYLLTEWRHFLKDLLTQPDHFRGAMRSGLELAEFLIMLAWYAGYTGMGLLTFFVAVWPLDRVFKLPFVWRALFFTACALGVYLGLIPRYNSWNVLLEPLSVIHTAIDALFHAKVLILVVGLAALLFALYTLFDIFMDGLALRLKAIKAR